MWQRPRKSNPYQYNQSRPVPLPGCQFKREEGCTVQACDEQAAAGWTGLAGLDALPGLVPTLQMATIPLSRPRIPLPASNTNSNTPWTPDDRCQVVHTRSFTFDHTRYC